VTGPILAEAHWLFPLVLFPSAVEHPHTLTLTRREVVRGIKSATSRVSLELWENELVVRGRLTGRVRLRIPLESIRSVEPWEWNQRMVSVTFGAAQWGRLARFMISGAPGGRRDRIVLAVEDPDRWMEELDRLRS
jgi:hypothetical protein